MFDELRALISFLQRRSLSIDGLVFGVSCRMTAIIMLAGLCVVCSTQLIGKPIHCDCVGSRIEQSFLETYCFIYPTYIVYFPEERIRQYRNDPRINQSGIFPGVLTYRRRSGMSRTEPLVEINIAYYQWVWVIYFLQALSFYFPHWLWKAIEGGRIRSLVSHADLLVDQNHCESLEYIKLLRIAHYVVNSFGFNDRYMWSYYLCEVIAFLNLFLQVYALNLVFGGYYLTYGLDSLGLFFPGGLTNNNSVWRQLDQIYKIFPRMTKCEYRRYGPSGASEKIDSLCMLTLNVFNDKFFLFLWFWMALLMVLFVITFLYRMAHIAIPRMHTQLIYDVAKREDMPAAADINSALAHLKMSDWFFLNLIANNVDRLFLGRLINEILHCVQNKKDSNKESIKSKYQNQCWPSNEGDQEKTAANALALLQSHKTDN